MVRLANSKSSQYVEYSTCKKESMNDELFKKFQSIVKTTLESQFSVSLSNNFFVHFRKDVLNVPGDPDTLQIPNYK